MMTDELTTGRMISGSFLGHDHVEAFRETYGRALMQLEIDPLPGHAFELDFKVWGFSGLGMASGSLTPTRNRHIASMSDNDDVVLVYTPQGCGTLAQIGREATIRDGEALFVTNGLSGTFWGNVPSRLCNFRFSRSLLNALTGDIETALVKQIPKDQPVLRLLTGYASVVEDAQALATPELRRLVSTHMHDLAALLLGPTRDAAVRAKQRGIRAARLMAIKKDILANIVHRDLTLDWLAKRHGVSPRSIRDLFSSERTTFTDHVLGLRLTRAHRLLCDPRFSDRTISSIAFESGFGDLSYFNHMFRRRYSATPSDIRRAALGGAHG